MRRFEFSDSTSNKFWEVDVNGKTLNVTFGKIGTKGASKPKDFATPEKAKAEMEKLIKEKTGKGYVEAGGKGVKTAKSAVGKKTDTASMGEGLSKAEKKAKAEKVLARFADGQWEMARGILEAAQEEHWLFEELLKDCEIKDGIPVPSVKIMNVFHEIETHEVCYHDEDGDLVDSNMISPVIAELAMLEILLHLPKDFKKLQNLKDKLVIKLRAGMLSKFWNGVVEEQFKGVKYGHPENFPDQWYDAREAEIAKVEKEGEARATILKMPWKEEEDLGQGVKLEMVLIPAGKFMMGSPKQEKDRYDDETQHEVTITKTFYMGKFEVTQEQWEAVMGKNPSAYKGPKLPVNNISWNDCKEFIKKLNGITKNKYRLPTEAEWEYACRAGTTTAYYFGDKITLFDANSKIDKPLAVGTYKPNAFGLYDMYGNVWEWCEDWKADYPKGAVIDPKGPAKGEYRVYRGGAVNSRGKLARSSTRYSGSPANRRDGEGFRLARSI
jgi:formylglycine-generating enzyme required for sulfatase activity/predicted DNA-binding WGR domain protein